MGFISFSLNYYEDKIEYYEHNRLTKDDIYEAKQLLKMIDDLIDEGYTELYDKIEAEFHGVTRIKQILELHNEKPFEIQKHLVTNQCYDTEQIELTAGISKMLKDADIHTDLSDNPFLQEMLSFCKWVGYDEDTAYIFLLRDTLLVYLYFMKMDRQELYPWLIGRDFMNHISSGNNIDDVVRASFFDALEAGCNDFYSFKEYCTTKIGQDLKRYPEVITVINQLLSKIKKRKIIVIESGCHGTFPMLLSTLDERVDFKLFTTVPYFNKVYKDRIYTTAYEKNRLFETLYSQDQYMRFSGYNVGKFYINKTRDKQVTEKSLSEIKTILVS